MGRGIQIDASADNVNIDSNEIYNITGFSGIVIDTGATGAKINKNYIHNNEQGVVAAGRSRQRADSTVNPWITGLKYTGGTVFPSSGPVVLQAKLVNSDGLPVPVPGVTVEFFADTASTGVVTTDVLGLTGVGFLAELPPDATGEAVASTALRVCAREPDLSYPPALSLP